MKNKSLSMEDRKQLYLEMLIEIDAFCRCHGIKYSLSSGTLIGALRHKGFIPWDDDLDITMSLPDMLKFKKEFKSENLRFCDIDMCDDYVYSFPRIESMKTYSKHGPFNKSYGLSIDVYIVIGLPDDQTMRNKFLYEAQQLYIHKKRIMKYNRFLTRRLPIKILPCYKSILRRYRDFLFDESNDYDKSHYYFRVASAMTDKLIAKNTLDFDFFDNLVDVEFEGHTFCATSHAHEYLSQRYGDYMTPPPVDQRIPYHGIKYYWE